MNLSTKRLKIENKSGEKLVCIEARPAQLKTKLPVVILCHGFAYFKEEDGLFTEVAKRLAARDFAVYYFDFSGCGESEGNFEQTTLTKLIDDLKAVYETVIKIEDNDPGNVSLVSHSFGSNVIIGAQIPHLKRIVLSGSFDNPRQIIAGLFPGFNEHGISIRRGIGDRTTTIGPQFWQDLENYNLTDLIHNFDCPILFVHGKLDDIVPIENMQPLLKTTKQPAGPLVLKQSNHDLNPEREQAFQAIVDFFTK